MEICNLEIREMVALAKVSFKKTQSVTYEQYKLFNRHQKTGERLESFHAALTVQAAMSVLGTVEDEIVRDLFISKTRNADLQDTLIFETLSPDEVLKRALKFTEGSTESTEIEQTNSTSVPNSNATTASASQFAGSQIKIKQEPVIAVGKRNQNSRSTNRDH